MAIKHGMTKTPTYTTWENMISRTTPGTVQYKNCIKYYRGIKVCKRWKTFSNFFADMGEKPAGKSIDRIDGTKGYNLDNCRWATKKEQQNNLKSNHYLEINGVRKTVCEWSEISGRPDNTIITRLQRGASHYDAVFAKSKFNPVDAKEIIRLRKLGYSLSMVARELKISVTQAHYKSRGA